MRTACVTWRIFGFFIFFILVNALSTFAHPHPLVSITGYDDQIIIHSLHRQKIDLPYLKENFVLEDCDYEVYLHDPSAYQKMETKIFIYHNCSTLKIKKNTLFEDYWRGIPIIVQIKGFDDSEGTNNMEKQIEEHFEKNIQYYCPKCSENSEKAEKKHISTFTLGNIRLPENPLLLLPFLFIAGGFFAIIGDFFNLVLPISLSSKNKKNKLIWLKSGIIHIISTYIVLFLSLNIISYYFLKYSGFLVIFVGFTMLLENYLNKKNVSPLLVAVIPCSGALFVSSIIFEVQMALAYAAPLIMGIGELFILKAGSMIPYPQKYLKYAPFLIILSGIFLVVRFVG